jgi:hypothetical protein
MDASTNGHFMFDEFSIFPCVLKAKKAFSGNSFFNSTKASKISLRFWDHHPTFQSDDEDCSHNNQRHLSRIDGWLFF